MRKKKKKKRTSKDNNSDNSKTISTRHAMFGNKVPELLSISSTDTRKTKTKQKTRNKNTHTTKTATNLSNVLSTTTKSNGTHFLSTIQTSLHVMQCATVLFTSLVTPTLNFSRCCCCCFCFDGRYSPFDSLNAICFHSTFLQATLQNEIAINQLKPFVAPFSFFRICTLLDRYTWHISIPYIHDFTISVTMLIQWGEWPVQTQYAFNAL